MPRMALAARLILNCCGCGHEPATVGVGDNPANPDETYGRRCWADPERWDNRPPHSHLDGDEHIAACTP